MSVPLYQAFLSFKSMEEDDRKKIVQDAQELLNNMNYRVTETLTFLKAILTPQYHAIMVQNASVYEKEDEILVFLDKVNMQLNTFAGMFNIFLETRNDEDEQKKRKKKFSFYVSDICVVAAFYWNYHRTFCRYRYFS